MIATTNLKPDAPQCSSCPVDSAALLLEALPVRQAADPHLLRDIMVAVDASNPSLVTLHYAAELVNACSTPLVALIFVDGRIEPEIGFGQGDTTTYLVAEWEAALREAVALARQRVRSFADCRGLSITIGDDVARFEHAIANASRGASCLVVGRRGRYIRQAGLSRKAIARILEQTGKAVLVAPVEWTRIRRVSVVLSDPEEDRDALGSAFQVAGAVRAPLEIVAVAERRELWMSALEQVRRMAGNGPLRTTFSARPGGLSDDRTWQAPPECLLVVGRSAQRRTGNGQPVNLVDSILRMALGPVLFSSSSVEMEAFKHERRGAL